MTAELHEVDIVRLGAQGDGIADTPAGPLYVPFALPGERVRTSGEGLPQLLSPPSGDRRDPICRHFGSCGGCVAQHMGKDLYARWKRAIVVEAFRQRGLEPEVAALVPVSAASRRRAVFTAKRAGSKIVLGYHGRRSHELFDLEKCPVLRPEIVAQLAALRAIAGLATGGEARLDRAGNTGRSSTLAIEAERGAFNAKASGQLARTAVQHRLARVSVDGETMLECAALSLALGGTEVIPPPGAFVQAAAEPKRLWQRSGRRPRASERGGETGFVGPAPSPFRSRAGHARWVI